MIEMNELLQLDQAAAKFFKQDIFCAPDNNYDCYTDIKKKFLKCLAPYGIAYNAQASAVVFNAVRVYYIFSALDALVDKIKEKAKQVNPNFVVTIKDTSFTSPTNNDDFTIAYTLRIFDKTHVLAAVTIGYSPLTSYRSCAPFDDNLLMKPIDDDALWFAGGYYFNGVQCATSNIIQKSCLKLRGVWNIMSSVLDNLPIE